MKLSRVLAVFSVSFVATFTSAAHADDWGCEVLLCLSNPAGPTAVSQCVPPIKRLYAAIFKRKPDPFPTCDTAVSPEGKRSYANVVYNSFYDPCPTGTTALPVNSYAVMGTAAMFHELTNTYFSSFSVGIGDGSGLAPTEDTPLVQKTCVGKHVGNVQVTKGSGEDRNVYEVGVYDRVTFVVPAQSGNLIKVFINDEFYRSVRTTGAQP